MDQTPFPAQSATRDVIVVGASSGGIIALQNILAELPSDLAAAVLIVVHLGEVSQLSRVLSQRSTLPVEPSQSGLPIQRGHVYVATPDKHMMLHDSHILLRRGPRENLARPAIDPLFRSAAATYTSRVIGVVLSGSLSDGTAGLRAIKRCGGLAVVQTPQDAFTPDMPLSALRHVDVDHVVPSNEIAALLGRLVTENAPPPPPEVPFDIRLETAIAAQEVIDMAADDFLGRPSRYTCPECHGTLWEVSDGTMVRYRCHTGHAFTADAMLNAQSEQIENTLYNLLRVHTERADLVRRLADRAEAANTGSELRRRAAAYQEDAELLRTLILARTAPGETGPEG